MNYLAAPVIFLFSYLIGSFPSGYLIGKFNGIDIRRHGSKNIGATNVRRTLGRDWGVICFILDFLKGYLAVILIGRTIGAHYSIGPGYGMLIASVGSICGHVFPVWLKFKGGKGVATSLGVVVGISFLSFLIGGLTWLLLFHVKRIVSIASMGAVIAMALAAALFQLFRWHAVGWPCVILFVVIAAVVIIRHKDNIIRLKNGTENAFKKP